MEEEYVRGNMAGCCCRVGQNLNAGHGSSLERGTNPSPNWLLEGKALGEEQLASRATEHSASLLRVSWRWGEKSGAIGSERLRVNTSPETLWE